MRFINGLVIGAEAKAPLVVDIDGTLIGRCRAGLESGWTDAFDVHFFGGEMRQSAFSDRRAMTSLIGVAIVLAAIGVPLITLADYAPLQDYSEWVFQAHVFNRLVAGAPSDTFSIRSYPVPYAVAQLALSALLTSFSPFIASKIYIGIYFALAGIAIWNLVRQRHLTSYAFLFLAVATTIGSCFWSGYIGFQMGVVAFCLYVALPEATKTKLGVIVTFSVLLFFCHGIAFVAFCVAAAAYCIYRKKITTLVMGMVPAGLLTLSYFLNNTSTYVLPPGAPKINGPATFIQYKIYTLAKLGAYQNLVYEQIDDAKINSLIPTIGLGVNLLFCFLLITAVGMLAFRAITKSAHDPELIAGAVLFLVFLVLPPTTRAIANPGERLLYPMLILLAPALFGRAAISPHLGKAMVASLAIGLVLTGYGVLTIPEKQKLAATKVESLMAPSSEGTQRILFEHRLTQFDEKMRETERAWHSRQLPRERLAWDTSLISQR